MNNKRKKLLTIALIIIVILLGGAAIYIANQLSSRQAVAPNAPTSRPAAAENAPAPGRFRATTKTTSTDSSTGSWLDGTIDSSNNNLITYSDFAVTTAGTYIFEAQYSKTDASETTWIGGSACILEATASAIICIPSGVITCASDCPTDCGKEASTISSCTDSCGVAATKTCAATAACAAKTNLSCNTTCTSDDQCSSGLICDSTSNKCRKAACTTETDCACTTMTTTTTRTTTTTVAPTATVKVTTTAPTATVTETTIAVATPTILPETGIFDLPGIAAFGGGLFLAVIGILLAL